MIFNDLEIAEELWKCSQGFEGFKYWAENYCFTYDRETGQKKHFADFKNLRYKDYIFKVISKVWDSLIARRNNILTPDKEIIKSRQLYFTWAFMAFFTWGIQFLTSFSATVTSEKAEKIDIKHNHNTLLGKVDYIVRNQPYWMIPGKNNWDDAHMRRGVIGADSWIKGDAGDEPTRSEQTDIILADEFAFQSFTNTKLAAMREGAKCAIILLSSPNGQLNSFYMTYKFAKNNPTKTSFEIIMPHWKDRIAESDWDEFYQRALRRYNGDMAQLEQELNHSFAGVSGQGRVFDRFDFNKHVIPFPVRVLKGVALNGLDFGYGAPGVMVATIRIKNVTVVFDSYQASGLHPRDHAAKIKEILNKWGLTIEMCRFFSDPSGKSKPREGTNESSFDLYRENGIYNIIPANNRILEGIQQINGCFFNNSLFIASHNVELIDGLNQAVWVSDNQGFITKEAYDIPHPYIDLVDGLRYAIMQSAKGISKDAVIEDGIGTNKTTAANMQDDDFDAPWQGDDQNLIGV